MSQRDESGIRIQTDDLCDSDSGLSYTRRDGRVALDLGVILHGPVLSKRWLKSLAQRTDDPFKLLLLCNRLGWETVLPYTPL